jgi:pimeloyl-ACP methyl ester carboxylesterase
MSEALYMTLLQFPLSGLQKEITAVSQSPNALSVLFMHGDCDRTGHLLPSFKRWKAIFQQPSSTLKRFEFWVVKDTAHNFFMEKPHETGLRIVTFFREVSMADS